MSQFCDIGGTLSVRKQLYSGTNYTAPPSANLPILAIHIDQSRLLHLFLLHHMPAKSTPEACWVGTGVACAASHVHVRHVILACWSAHIWQMVYNYPK